MGSAVDTLAAAPAGPRALVDTRDTSAQARDEFGMRKLSQQQRAIFDVVLGLQRNGAQDASLSEIQQRYEFIHGKRIDLGRVSARVSEMVDVRMERRSDTRACKVTGRQVHPVYIPEGQGRLFV